MLIYFFRAEMTGMISVLILMRSWFFLMQYRQESWYHSTCNHYTPTRYSSFTICKVKGLKKLHAVRKETFLKKWCFTLAGVQTSPIPFWAWEICTQASFNRAVFRKVSNAKGHPLLSFYLLCLVLNRPVTILGKKLVFNLRWTLCVLKKIFYQPFSF